MLTVLLKGEFGILIHRQKNPSKIGGFFMRTCSLASLLESDRDTRITSLSNLLGISTHGLMAGTPLSGVDRVLILKHAVSVV